jgi:hypothetical protein
MPQENTIVAGQAQLRLGPSVANQLCQSAEQFARTNWSSKLPTIDRIEMNPCLVQDCPCVKRFFQGAGISSGDAISGLNTRFAFHGTTPENVISICHNGFQPSRRRSNANGYGEYFGSTGEVSHGYCKGTNHMIVALIVRNGEVNESGGTYCIVMNPKSDTGASYCLPVAVVSFGCGHGMTSWAHV